jgi:hypothetical protein
MSDDRALTPVSAEGNPMVDLELVERAKKVRRQLEECGIDTSGGYRLAPALGGTIVGNPRRATTVTQISTAT